MAKEIQDYGLDLHGTMMLEEYREKVEMFNRMKDVVLSQ